ncbi:MAG: hypothetical protein HYV39_00175 [Candidatus Levybacteria bacterium]|nr:hypothetical protein [Candidatus Levybacteria bacterium]
MRESKGQTLIEILAAFGVAVVLVTAISIAVLSALSNAQFSKNQNLATQYAQEGMETVRRFAALSPGDYCLDKNSKNSSDLRLKGTGCGRNIDGIFTREITIEENSSKCLDTKKVTALVSWSDSKCTSSNDCHKAELVSCLPDINAVPIP